MGKSVFALSKTALTRGERHRRVITSSTRDMPSPCGGGCRGPSNTKIFADSFSKYPQSL